MTNRNNPVSPLATFFLLSKSVWKEITFADWLVKKISYVNSFFDRGRIVVPMCYKLKGVDQLVASRFMERVTHMRNIRYVSNNMFSNIMPTFNL